MKKVQWTIIIISALLFASANLSVSVSGWDALQSVNVLFALGWFISSCSNDNKCSTRFGIFVLLGMSLWVAITDRTNWCTGHPIENYVFLAAMFLAGIGGEAWDR